LDIEVTDDHGSEVAVGSIPSLQLFVDGLHEMSIRAHIWRGEPSFNASIEAVWFVLARLRPITAEDGHM
jgi:hypothetical protein